MTPLDSLGRGLADMVMILEPRVVNTIAEIGRQRAPKEACGLLLPTPINGVQVIELPNYSDNPEDSFEMKGQDMFRALEMAFQGDFPAELVASLTAWHTHPKGNLGPSPFDMHNKPAHLKSLVVTLDDSGGAKATWY